VVAALVGRPAFWAVAVAMLGGWPLISGLLRRPPPPPPVLGALPGFELTDPAGERVDLGALAGRVWVVGFVDRGCVACAQRVAGAMERLQYRARNVGSAVGLLSVAVDSPNPVSDVAVEAARHHANPRQWRVAGGRDARPLLLAVAELAPQRAAMLNTGSALALVDAQGRLRAVEGVEPPASLDRLVSAMTLILNIH
jgi:cytochrome oxidase Cu insertion factor (SCO1/SenC/PrrC family)